MSSIIFIIITIVFVKLIGVVIIIRVLVVGTFIIRMVGSGIGTFRRCHGGHEVGSASSGVVVVDSVVVQIVRSNLRREIVDVSNYHL